MNMRKTAGALTAVLATVLLVFVLVQSSRAISASPLSARMMEVTTTAPSYVVREWDGRLAVFIKGQTNPDMIYEDVAVASLPQAEQERLREGIEVPDRSALNRLLEDYTS